MDGDGRVDYVIRELTDDDMTALLALPVGARLVSITRSSMMGVTIVTYSLEDH